jgi:hypothetical protein
MSLFNRGGVLLILGCYLTQSCVAKDPYPPSQPVAHVSLSQPRILYAFGGILSRAATVFGSSVAQVTDPENLDLSLDGILSERSGSIRLFVIDVSFNGGEPNQVFPVVLDTGSPHTWIASDDLAQSLIPRRPGYLLEGTAPVIQVSRDRIGYFASRTMCREWRHETLSFGEREWKSPVCISSSTTVTLTAINGVLGADLSSELVSHFGVFWLIPQQVYPKVGIILGDRITPEHVCRGGELAFAGVPWLSSMWRVGGTVKIGNTEVESVFARIDTGSNRVYLTPALWRNFVVILMSLNVELKQDLEFGDYYSEKVDMALLPTIHLVLGEFKFDLTPEMYVIPFDQPVKFAYQLFDFESARGDTILVGAPVLTRVVTKWDSNFPPNVGFCLPLLV